MKKVSVAELKAKLSEYLGYAKHGEEIIVTDHGKPIARLTPLPDRAAFDEHIQDLVRRGLARAPEKKLDVKEFLAMAKGSDPEGAVLEALLEERREDKR